MDFFSLTFFKFSSVVLITFFATPARFRWVVLLAASIYFYATFNVAYLAVLTFCTLAAYFAALAMERWPEPKNKKRFLILTLVANLGMLGFFKYIDFLDASLGQLLHAGGITYSTHALNILAPAGISFYVFQIVSYLVDVYRGKAPAEKHAGIFALYVSFFPKILSGPIERAGSLISQLRQESRFDIERITNGLKLICWGLFKKLVIADRLAAFVNVVYADPEAHTGVSLTLAVVFYSFQIYCDFSGYTDIAIGLAQMFGFRLADNFDRPYTATSVGDFWRRWHMSLSFWLRDYLYIPLGGSRVAPYRHYLNYLIVFFICGLWHGAAWTFVVWGLVHGLYLIAGKASAGPRAQWASFFGLDRVPALHRALKILVTFSLVSLAWVFFRARTLNDAFYVLTHLHAGWNGLLDAKTLGEMIFLTGSRLDMIIVLACLAFFSLVHGMEKHANMRQMFAGKPLWLRFAFYYLMAGGLLVLSLPNTEISIYFQF
ncbi:MAG: MBOAT family O-acyltransferase [Thermodesulfobacteriota bacterium]